MINSMVKVEPCLVVTIHEYRDILHFCINILFVDFTVYTPSAHAKSLSKIQISLNYQLCSSDAFIFQVAATRLH